MYVKAVKLYEDGGRPLPRHRVITAKPSCAGWFSYKEIDDRELRRTMMKAWLEAGNGQPDVLPALHDAVIMFVDRNKLIVRGLERDEISGRMTAMTWYCEVIDPDKSPTQDREQKHAMVEG